jgi:methionine-rich copper-binding protein CopC
MYSRCLIGLSLWCALLSCLNPNWVWAHAYPDAVSPPDGAGLTKAPSEVKIQFTEGVELEFSRIEVKSTTGQRVNKGSIRRLAADTLAIDLLPLQPGDYTIEWRVLSVDTHITEGVLRFTVKSSGK